MNSGLATYFVVRRWGGFRDLMVCDFHRDGGVLEMFVEDVGISKKVVCFFLVKFGFVEGDFF